MDRTTPQCAKCTVFRCRTKEKGKKVPQFCPTEEYPELVRESIEKSLLPENLVINKAWAQLMDNLSKDEDRSWWPCTRVEEIIEYARVRGMKRIGIGSCISMMHEAKLLSDILEWNGFEVVSVSCMCGEVKPEELDIEAPIACNPILQAEVLNREKTELNIMVGLCLGHDIMFLRYCEAETTPLVVKDRALGHNTVAALHLSTSYYKSRFYREKK